MEKEKENGYFDLPRFTQTPNIFFDVLMPQIETIAEEKVTLVLIRQTFGWHKTSDKISQNQLVKKTGLKLRAVKAGLDKGIERGTIIKVKDHDSKTQTPAEYSLNLKKMSIPTHTPPPYVEGQEVSEAGSLDGTEGRVLPRGGTKESLLNKKKTIITSGQVEEDEKEKPLTFADVYSTYRRAYNCDMSQINRESICGYIDDGLPIEVVIYAMKYSAEKCKSYGHTKTILTDWLKHKVKNIEEAKKRQEEFFGSKKTNNSKNLPIGEHYLGTDYTKFRYDRINITNESERRRKEKQKKDPAVASREKNINIIDENVVENKVLLAEVLKIIKSKITDVSFRTWFTKNSLQLLEKDNAAIITCSDNFTIQWLEKGYGELIKDVLEDLGKIYDTIYFIKTD